jgi:hypothetical protein
MTYPRAFMMPMGRRKYQGRITVVLSRKRVVSVGRKGKVMYEEIRLQPYLKTNSKVQTKVINDTTSKYRVSKSMWIRIHNTGFKQCCGSRMSIPDQNFSIPDPGSEFFPSRIQELKY